MRVGADDAGLARAREVATAGPYQPTWESLQQYPAPRWYSDAKLGILLH